MPYGNSGIISGPRDNFPGAELGLVVAAPMKYGSVCSGIEAATCAWHPLGWRPQWFSEIAPFPSALLKYRYPKVPNLGDMTKIITKRSFHVRTIDLLVGGTPCQSFSVAGLRKGMDDPRGNLALEFLRLAATARPRWILWENVPGVLSSSGGRDFGAFVGALAQLGYGWCYRVLDAQYFGVPQRRRRVFLVGYLGDWRRAAAVLFERESLRRNPPKGREARKGVAALTAAGVGASGPDDNQAQAGHPIARCLTSSQQRYDLDTENFVFHTLCGEGFDASTAGTLMGRESKGPRPDSTLIPFDTTQITSRVNRSNPRAGDPCHPVTAHGHAPAIAFSCRDYGADVGPMGTLRHGNGNESGGVPFVELGGVRRLTPMECERLQGFPDDYTRVPYRHGKLAEDGPRYQAIGNSMAVPVMAWIGQRIQMVEDLVREGSIE